jgi:hypothetical protein
MQDVMPGLVPGIHAGTLPQGFRMGAALAPLPLRIARHDDLLKSRNRSELAA